MRRARRRWKVLTVVVAAPLAALVVAVSLAGDDPPAAATAHPHLFPADYFGPVWLQFPESASTLEVDIVWGEWTHGWTVGPRDPRSYVFMKSKPRPGDPNIPVEVTVDHPIDVEFGYGTFPTGAERLPDEWEPVGDSGA